MLVVGGRRNKRRGGRNRFAYRGLACISFCLLILSLSVTQRTLYFFVRSGRVRVGHACRSLTHAPEEAKGLPPPTTSFLFSRPEELPVASWPLSVRVSLASGGAEEYINNEKNRELEPPGGYIYIYITKSTTFWLVAAVLTSCRSPSPRVRVCDVSVVCFVPLFLCRLPSSLCVAVAKPPPPFLPLRICFSFAS